MYWRKILPIVLLSFPALTCAQTTAPTAADFWDDTSIKDIHLTVDPTDWATLRQNFQANDYYKADFSWNGVAASVGIRSRGNGSRSAIKPNLDVNFSKYVKKQTFLNTSLLVFKANNQDASTIRERIVFKLFAKMGLPVPREVPARVFVNDEYFGYFNIVEHLDEDFLQRNFGENGGYFYEWQTPAIYNFENLGTDPNTYAPFLELKTDQDDGDYAWFVRLVSAINQSSDADLVANVSQYLNPRLYLTHAAIENVVGEIDGIVGGVFGMNNFYLYRFQNSNLSQFVVWDKDLSFFTTTRDIFDGTQTNVLVRRLLAIPEYRNVYLDALVKAANLLGGQNGWGDQEVTREYNQIQNIAVTDPNKQCIKDSVPAPCSVADFQNGIESLHTFMAVRIPSVLGDAQKAGYTSPSNKPTVTSVAVAGQNGTARLVPGALVTVNVNNFGSGSLVNGPNLPRTIGSSFLAIGGIRAPIASATATQITVQVPWDLELGTTSLVGANDSGQLGNTLDVTVVQQAPAIFAITHANGTVVSSGQAVVAGETLSIFATGLGVTSQYFDPGTPAPSNAVVSAKAAVSVTIGNASAPVLFAGLAPGFAGLYQINLTVPPGISSGSAVLNLTTGDQTTSSTIEAQ